MVAAAVSAPKVWGRLRRPRRALAHRPAVDGRVPRARSPAADRTGPHPVRQRVHRLLRRARAGPGEAGGRGDDVRPGRASDGARGRRPGGRGGGDEPDAVRPIGGRRGGPRRRPRRHAPGRLGGGRARCPAAARARGRRGGRRGGRGGRPAGQRDGAHRGAGRRRECRPGRSRGRRRSLRRRGGGGGDRARVRAGGARVLSQRPRHRGRAGSRCPCRPATRGAVGPAVREHDHRVRARGGPGRSARRRRLSPPPAPPGRRCS
jgi:hypothetical protein